MPFALSMNPVLIVYATREGHTARIAEYIALGVRCHGGQVDVKRAGLIGDQDSIAKWPVIIVAASIHIGKHEAEIVHFVKAHLAELSRARTLFLSVSLSQAGVEDDAASPEKHAQARADVERMIRDFLVKTGWRPTMARPVAGALPYTKFNPFLRFIMKRIARKAGGPTDTSRDHVFTNWGELDRMVEDLLPIETNHA